MRTLLKGQIEVHRWEVVDDQTGYVHHVTSTLDGEWITCRCPKAKAEGQCPAMEAVAIQLEAEADPNPKVH